MKDNNNEHDTIMIKKKVKSSLLFSTLEYFNYTLTVGTQEYFTVLWGGSMTHTHTP